jgi:hypothetical protein
MKQTDHFPLNFKKFMRKHIFRITLHNVTPHLKTASFHVKV